MTTASSSRVIVGSIAMIVLVTGSGAVFRPRRRLQQARVERKRQQIFQPIPALLLPEIGEDHLQIASEFPEDLPAGAAWRRRALGGGGDSDASESAVPFGDRVEHG